MKTSKIHCQKEEFDLIFCSTVPTTISGGLELFNNGKEILKHAVSRRCNAIYSSNFRPFK
jgi:hypothetical protein